MAIALRSQSNLAYGTRTNGTVPAPAGIQNGDILICEVYTEHATPAPTPTMSGFAEFGTATTVIFGGVTQVRLSIFWKRASGEAGDYAVTHSSCESDMWMGCFSGCIASVTPLSATSNNTGTGTTSTGTGITTTAANSWLLYISHNWTPIVALSPPAGMQEQFDDVGGVLYVATELRTAAGATSNRTQTNSNSGGSDIWGVRMVELLASIDPAPYGGQSHGIARHNFYGSR